MNTAGGIMIASLAALAAAGAFGVAAALQHQQARQARHAATAGRPSVRLLTEMARRPLWLAGIALATAAYGLQAVALTFGPLTLVAPIVAADLLFALPLAAWWSRRPLRARDWAGCLLVASGVAVFLWTSPPSSGQEGDVPAGDWILVFAAVAVISVLAVTAGKIASSAARAGMLATAAGIIFGLTAAVTASLTRSLRQEGLGSILTHWQPWVLVSLGITGLLLSTSAFQAGALSASLPIMDTVEPVSGVIIGALVFNERLASSPAGLAVQLGAAAVAATGIALLGPSLGAMQSPAAIQPGAAAPAPRAPRAEDRRSRLGAPSQQHRMHGAPARCDLLRVARNTTTAEESADHLRHLRCG